MVRRYGLDLCVASGASLRYASALLRSICAGHLSQIPTCDPCLLLPAKLRKTFRIMKFFGALGEVSWLLRLPSCRRGKLGRRRAK